MMASLFVSINIQYYSDMFKTILLSAANARHEAELRLLASLTPSALASPCVWHPLNCASNSAIVLVDGKFQIHPWINLWKV